MLRLISQPLLLALIACASFAHARERVVVLVPGFFNIPGKQTNADTGLHYFSKTIVAAVRASGFIPEVIEDLNPVGSILENGEKVLAHLEQIVQAHAGAEFTLIGHSSGGLYIAH